jgi:hypothetical protein
MEPKKTRPNQIFAQKSLTQLLPSNLVLGKYGQSCLRNKDSKYGALKAWNLAYPGTEEMKPNIYYSE